ncbi:hypothetical protein [Shewanella sp. Isolate11]|uniref:hypothetical protein n=1 Tax=Shewanella sp. Isolate11 TaxID=2908530 RepID=UPI001EFD6C13|nr:hypothetical protein [Shewanella sp. Isolate11]MCG9697919.1 hypothetical protein [Shewanella sp. Isolate11]
MLVVTNYPQVPIATTNAATDSARVDSQQRPPIIPAPQLAKNHEERAFNPQHERVADDIHTQAKLHEKVQKKQQGDSQQQSQQQKEQSRKAAITSMQAQRYKPALQRRDVSLPQGTNYPCAETKAKSSTTKTASNNFYQKVSEHINHFYQNQSLPKGEPAFSTLV